MTIENQRLTLSPLLTFPGQDSYLGSGERQRAIMPSTTRPSGHDNETHTNILKPIPYMQLDTFSKKLNVDK